MLEAEDKVIDSMFCNRSFFIFLSLARCDSIWRHGWHRDLSQSKRWSGLQSRNGFKLISIGQFISESIMVLAAKQFLSGHTFQHSMWSKVAGFLVQRDLSLHLEVCPKIASPMASGLTFSVRSSEKCHPGHWIRKNQSQQKDRLQKSMCCSLILVEICYEQFNIILCPSSILYSPSPLNVFLLLFIERIDVSWTIAVCVFNWSQ